jgi:hypothetical protein
MTVAAKETGIHWTSELRCPGCYPPEVVSRTRSLAGAGHASGAARQSGEANSRCLHAWKLQSISVDWKAGTATFSLTWSDKPAALVAHGARP